MQNAIEVKQADVSAPFRTPTSSSDGNQVRAVFKEHRVSFCLREDATLGELADRLAVLADLYDEWPIDVAVRICSPMPQHPGSSAPH